jgi:hypothetical protein
MLLMQRRGVPLDDSMTREPFGSGHFRFTDDGRHIVAPGEDRELGTEDDFRWELPLHHAPPKPPRSE